MDTFEKQQERLNNLLWELMNIRKKQKDMTARAKEISEEALALADKGVEVSSDFYTYTVVPGSKSVSVNPARFKKAVADGVISEELVNDVTHLEVDPEKFWAKVDTGDITDEGIKACCKVTQRASSLRIKERKTSE